jgi:hypothetical protein
MPHPKNAQDDLLLWTILMFVIAAILPFAISEVIQYGVRSQMPTYELGFYCVAMGVFALFCLRRGVAYFKVLNRRLAA